MNNNIKLPHDHGTSNYELLKNRPEQEAFDKSAQTFALISDSTRLKILWLLCHSEECVANISATMEMSAPAISHHLRILKQAELLTTRRDGKEVYYTLAQTPEAALVHDIVDRVFNINCKK